MLLHVIVLGILIFEFVVFVTQWFLFRKKEFIYFSIFCLCVCIHNYLYNELIFGWTSFNNHQALDFFIRRQLSMMAILMYIKFAKHFVDYKESNPKAYPLLQKLQKLVIANMIWQTLAIFILRDEYLLDISFVICFLGIGLYAAFIGGLLMKDRNILLNFISLGSMAFVLGALILMFSNSLGNNNIDSQIFLDLGILANILLLNIGLIYKFNYLSQKEVENQKVIIHELKEKERLTNELNNVRKRISMDIHDDVLGGLSSIRISSDIIDVSSPEISQAFTKKISETAVDTAQRLNAIIWSLDHDNNSHNDFIQYVKEFAIKFFQNTGIKFSFKDRTNLTKTLYLTGDIRKNLFFTIKEALHNILKHANADDVKMTIGIHEQYLFIGIWDNGIGFIKERKFGTGLHNMRKRVEEIGGTISFRNENGVHVELMLKLN